MDNPASKPATFVGSSLDDLRDFPRSARRETGFQLDKVQNGEDADDWKPMPAVGNGVYEIRVQGRLRFLNCAGGIRHQRPALILRFLLSLRIRFGAPTIN